MPAYLKLGDLEGEATDQNHAGWILIESIVARIFRSIPPGAVDVERLRGETTLADLEIVRQVDKSTPLLAEACASGKFFTEAEIHLCTDINGRREPYLTYALFEVIVSTHVVQANGTGLPLPSEQTTLNFTAAVWSYMVLDPETGDNLGVVEGTYFPNSRGYFWNCARKKH